MATNYKAKPLSRLNIQHRTDELRKALGLGGILRINVLTLLECVIAKYDDSFNYEIVKDNEIPEMALYYPGKNSILIRESIYDGARNGCGRDRYTIMHEIAHYILHDNNSIVLARGNEKIKTYEDPEWQANAFAGEFLMPRELIKKMKPNEIQEKCGVSLKAATYQHKKINEHK